MGYEPRSIVPGAFAFDPTNAFRVVWAPTRRVVSQIAVWDLGVRLFHWLLVGTVVGALVTGLFAPKSWLDGHVVLGTAVAALIVFRVIWGFTGSQHARFASFIVGPAAALRYLRTLLAGRAGNHIGHNPLGAMMIVALLLALGLLTATGLVALGGELKQGPFAAFTSFATGHNAKAIHQFLAYGLLGLIVLHVAGVAMESLRIRENIARAMLTGRKAVAGPRPARATVPARPRLAAAIFAVIAVATLPWIVHFARLPGLGVPTAPLDPVYAKECGACHTAYHPSLAPAATWRAVVAGLDAHFGDDASLAGPLTDRLLGYLVANSAEQWDSKPANFFRLPDAAQPLRITALPAWQHTHRRIPQSAFGVKAVGGKLNCSACHRDAASGRFAPQAIATPKERTTP
jgi:cytochrome b